MSENEMIKCEIKAEIKLEAPEDETDEYSRPTMDLMFIKQEDVNFNIDPDLKFDPHMKMNPHLKMDADLKMDPNLIKEETIVYPIYHKSEIEDACTVFIKEEEKEENEIKGYNSKGKIGTLLMKMLKSILHIPKKQKI